MGYTVRAKLYHPGRGDTPYEGTKWKQVHLDDYGKGTVEFVAHMPAHYTNFKVATEDNETVLLNMSIDRALGVSPLVQRRAGSMTHGVLAEPGDSILVDFVIAQYAFRINLNNDPGDDDEDLAILDLVRLQRRLPKPPG